MKHKQPICGNILIIDDQISDLKILEKAMREAGHQVQVANSGSAGIVSANIHKPDLVLCDIKMTEMDGYEFCRRLKTAPDFGNIPVILVSSADEIEDKLAGFEVGCVDYLLKPYVFKEILARIQVHLENSRLQQELQFAYAMVQQQAKENQEEQKSAFAALYESEQRFCQIAEHIEEMFFLYEAEGNKLLYMSGAISEIFGISVDMIFLDPTLIEKTIHPEDLAKINFIHPEIFYQQALTETFRIIRPLDGEIRWVRLRSFLVHNAQNRVIRTAGLAADITDIRNAQEENQRQQQQLIQADKMSTLGALVSGVAHEINNPNNLIMLNSDFLRRMWQEMFPILDQYAKTENNFHLVGLPYAIARKEVEALLNGVTVGAVRIQKIVAGLKDFSRTEIGSQEQYFDVNHMIEQSMLIVGNLIKKTTDNFIFEPEDARPLACGNGQQVEQVVINLLTNACQAIQERSKSLRIFTENPVGGREIRIIVKDEGMGISPEDLPKICDPFFTTKRDSGGTGLGLSVSYQILQSLGGSLSFESQLGQGTTATIVLQKREPS